jgi:hypothetical protein
MVWDIFFKESTSQLKAWQRIHPAMGDFYRQMVDGGAGFYLFLISNHRDG